MRVVSSAAWAWRAARRSNFIGTRTGSGGVGDAGHGTAGRDGGPGRAEAAEGLRGRAAVAAQAESSFAAFRDERVRKQARLYRPAPETEAPPLSLTASDGTGLELRRLTARAAVEGPLALTELHLIFHNPQPRVIEGRFSITLPQGAVISRLAMSNTCPGCVLCWTRLRIADLRAPERHRLAARRQPRGTRQRVPRRALCRAEPRPGAASR